MTGTQLGTFLILIAFLLLFVALDNVSISFSAESFIPKISTPSAAINPDVHFKTSPSPSAFIESFSTASPEAKKKPPKFYESELNEFRYPNSELIQSGDNSNSLESSDDSQIVTNWYKNKIINSSMEIKTFIQTNANEKIVNRLAGSDIKRKVEVEITKENDQSKTKIFINIIDFTNQEI